MKKLTLLYFIAILCNGCANKQEQKLLHHEDNPFKLVDSLKKYVSFHENQIALIHARVIDGTGQTAKTGQTILIEHGSFKAVGNDAGITIPEKFKIIDVKGKTVIPGIVGMHNHLHIPRFPFVGDIATKLYLASGITTIQTCGAASPEQEIALARQIAEGREIGPDIVTSAPFFTGEGGNPHMIIPRNEQHIRDTMQHWIRQGVQWFKVYRNTKPEDLKIILDEAHKNHCKVRGHFCSVTFEEATKLGVDGIEHGLNSASDFRTHKDFGVCNGGREYMDELIMDSPEVKKLQQLMIDHQVFLTSTASIYEASVPNRGYADERSLKAMSPYLLEEYKERRSKFDQAINDLTREKRLKRIIEFEYQFYKMGGLLCSGVDAGRHVLPGFGDQRNFELYIEAGFSTEEAVQVMTGNGAKALGNLTIGTIETGKRADFIILDGNLEKDASVIQKVETVFKNGIGYDPQKILAETHGKFGVE
ncbi:amidohydrolase family protein [Rapidithrix thailandica]|uniref:Amidohydrolase family protein n=1 Tax=Rapidithrix thailandica TaxID=413964 RepID=A0AAW9SGS5_9BACT